MTQQPRHIVLLGDSIFDNAAYTLVHSSENARETNGKSCRRCCAGFTLPQRAVAGTFVWSRNHVF
jgi:hypothetical protein